MPFDAHCRSSLPERMDSEPCDYEFFRDCLRDLARVNRLTFGYRPTLEFLARLAQTGRLPLGRPVHLVDVGSGYGDMLREIAAWARKRNIDMRLTGIDRNPWAARAAREAGGDGIAWICRDLFEYSISSTQPPDIVVSALFAHHLDEPELVRFLAWMDKTARIGWFVNDLHRHAVSYWGFAVLARAARWHPFVRHDGPLSIARAFRPADWQGALAAAAVDPTGVRIERRFPFRLCVARVK